MTVRVEGPKNVGMCEAEVEGAEVVGGVKVSVRGVGMFDAEPHSVIQQDDLENVLDDVEGEGLSLSLSLCLLACSAGFFFWAFALLAASSSWDSVRMSVEAKVAVAGAGGGASAVGVTRVGSAAAEGGA